MIPPPSSGEGVLQYFGVRWGGGVLAELRRAVGRRVFCVHDAMFGLKCIPANFPLVVHGAVEVHEEERDPDYDMDL